MSVSIEDFDLRKTFDTERKLLLFAGFYPRRSSKYDIIFFVALSINLFLSFGQIVSMTIQMFIDRNDLSKLAEALQYFITLVIYVCKKANFIYYTKMMLEIEDDLTVKTFYGFSQQQLILLKEKLIFSNRVAKTFRIFCVICVMFYALNPYLDSTKFLPFPGWFPYNVTKYYFPTFMFQCLGISNTAYSNSTIDILTWTLISLGTAQFEILKDNLKEIQWNQGPDVVFKNCIKHHLDVVKFVNKIEKTFSKGILLQFCASIIVICFSGFSVMIVPFGSGQFFSVIFYFGCMMIQCAMYCWFGHDILTTSEKVGDFFFMSNWYESDLKIRKNIFIFMERIKRPIKMTASGYVVLSLTTLTGILRSSYSYFAVLRRLYTDK